MADCTRVPTELWRAILTGACTDGGFTGKSLALTNKFFHAQSLSTRFHSLSLTSLARIKAFLSFLETQPKECNPTIHHLYLSFLDETEPANPPAEFWRTYSRWTKLEKQEYLENVQAEKERWNVQFIAAMTRLFDFAGPHHRTLCILESIHLRFPHVPVNSLPKLQELSLLGGYELFMLEKLPRTPSPNHPAFKFPSLQRLHCVCVHWSKPSDILTYLANRASPSFTHLRFSGLSFSFSSQFPYELGRCLGVDVPAYGQVHDGSAPKFTIGALASLRHVIVHGNPDPPGGWCGTDDGLWDDMCGHLQMVAQAVRDTGSAEMVQMSRPWRRDPRWADRLRDDWVERMEGGGGCWVRSEDGEIRREVYEDDPPVIHSGTEDEFGEEWY